MKTICYCILILTLAAGCKERYNPPVSSPQTGYLVVEGFINNGAEPTVIKLSRTTTLYDSVDNNSQVYEHSAQATIESNNNESYPLTETSNGEYVSSSLSLNGSEQYRLHIITTDGGEYVSDYTSVKTTPPIDSLNWTRDGDGVHIAINTHDPLNATKYYQWEYEETWEFHSAFSTSLLYKFNPSDNLPSGVIYRFPDSHNVDSAFYKCWHSPHSTNIILGSSEKLTEDRVYFPLINISAGAQQLSVLYSLKVNQHAVSKNNYSFLQKMKKNTETLGTIFDAQPSELQGNIHCITHSDEPVVGYIEISQLQSQRIYISNSQVLGWDYSQACREIEISNNADAIIKDGTGLTPTIPAKIMRDSIISFYVAEPDCVDCRLSGSNVKPDFWP